MLIAIAVPNIDEIISLVGITSGMLMAFILPATLEMITFLPVILEEKQTRFKMAYLIVKNVFLILIGFFGGIAGLYSTLKSILK